MLKGIDGFFRASENIGGQQQDSHSQPVEAPAVVDGTSDDSSNSFKDLPNFNIARSQ